MRPISGILPKTRTVPEYLHRGVAGEQRHMAMKRVLRGSPIDRLHGCNFESIYALASMVTDTVVVNIEEC
jgi:hypothetical protein